MKNCRFLSKHALIINVILIYSLKIKWKDITIITQCFIANMEI